MADVTGLARRPAGRTPARWTARTANMANWATAGGCWTAGSTSCSPRRAWVAAWRSPPAGRRSASAAPAGGHCRRRRRRLARAAALRSPPRRCRPATAGARHARPPAFERLVVPWSYAPPLDAGSSPSSSGGWSAWAGISGRRWPRRRASGSPAATWWCRYHCTGAGGGPAATTRRRASPCRWPAGWACRRPILPSAGGRRRPRPRSTAWSGGATCAPPSPSPAPPRDTPPAPVALVDDVVTTGATLDAAARCLLDAGAAAVVAMAAARTPEGI